MDEYNSNVQRFLFCDLVIFQLRLSETGTTSYFMHSTKYKSKFLKGKWTFCQPDRCLHLLIISRSVFLRANDILIPPRLSEASGCFLLRVSLQTHLQIMRSVIFTVPALLLLSSAFPLSPIIAIATLVATATSSVLRNLNFPKALRVGRKHVTAIKTKSISAKKKRKKRKEKVTGEGGRSVMKMSLSR